MLESAENLLKLLQQLVGQRSAFCSTPICVTVIERASALIESDLGLGFSQFNELLLQLGYDRICHEFFQFIVDGETDYRGDCIKTFDALTAGVDRFRKLALLSFGNVKFGFKTVAANANLLEASIARPVEPRKFEGRHKPALNIQRIPGNETYYLGYLIQSQIASKLAANPQDEVALAQDARAIA